MFADDICVFGPCISWLQRLLNICDDYAAEHEIALIFFYPKSINNLLHRMFF